MPESWVGLDFGTSNSAISLNHNGEIYVVNVDRFTGKTMRSVLYFDLEKNVFIGEEAILKYIENGAIGRYMQSIKSFLPSTIFDHTNINRKLYKLDDLISIILSKLRYETEIKANCDIKNVVLGRPVVFSTEPEQDNLAQDRLLSAAQKAGFKNICFEYEPIAAALAYEATLKFGETKIGFVGDFGGGTSDFAVVRLIGGAWQQDRNRNDHVLSVGGVKIGGDIFDSRIMSRKITKYFGRDARVKYIFSNDFHHVPYWIMENLSSWHIIPLLRDRKSRESIRNIKRHVLAEDRYLIENLEKLVDYNYGLELFRAIEKAKIELSTKIESKIIFYEDDIEIEENIKRDEFEKIIAEDVEDIQECIDSVIASSGIRYDGIDVVILTGGSSSIPIINKLFKKMFGEEKIREIDAFTSVANGLGLSSMKYIFKEK